MTQRKRNAIARKKDDFFFREICFKCSSRSNSESKGLVTGKFRKRFSPRNPSKHLRCSCARCCALEFFDDRFQHRSSEPAFSRGSLSLESMKLTPPVPWWYAKGTKKQEAVRLTPASSDNIRMVFYEIHMASYRIHVMFHRIKVFRGVLRCPYSVLTISIWSFDKVRVVFGFLRALSFLFWLR